jgi:hypothetical protein
MPREARNHTRKVLMPLRDTLPRSQSAVEVRFAK